MKSADGSRAVKPKSIFDQAVETIARQEGISKTEAMVKVRRTQPAVFDEFQKSAPPSGSSYFEKLVQEDMERGCTREVAMQRALRKGAARIGPGGVVTDNWSKTGDRENRDKADGAKDTFEELVHRMMMERSINRTRAMQAVARQRPDLVKAMRVVA